MLKFRGKPLLEHIIACAKKQGFNKLYLSVHYMPETIVNHFENGEKFGIEIQYLYEDKPLGTGEAYNCCPMVMSRSSLLMLIY